MVRNARFEHVPPCLWLSIAANPFPGSPGNSCPSCPRGSLHGSRYNVVENLVVTFSRYHVNLGNAPSFFFFFGNARSRNCSAFTR